MSRVSIIAGTSVAVTVCLGLITAGAQSPFADSQAITQFQRAVDSYAFQHRQVERRAGPTPDQRTMAGGMRGVRRSPPDGEIFTPLVADAFRARIAIALKAPGCGARIPSDGGDVVPRPGDASEGPPSIPGCIATMLPPLPAELEYRAAGVALVLVDHHARLVVDVLHAAFPRRDN